MPTAVVEQVDLDNVLAILEVSRATGAQGLAAAPALRSPAIPSAPGMVFDFGRHLNKVLEVDRSSRTALVEPGLVLSHVQKKVRSTCGCAPDPFTQNPATFSGMIDNHACGQHALAYGERGQRKSGSSLCIGEPFGGSGSP